MGPESYWFRYQFTFPDGTKRIFSITLDDTLRLRSEKRATYPEWTNLEHCKCDVCPLQERDSPQCPVAVNLVDAIEFFKSALSVEEVDVEIEVPGRTYSRKKVPLSQGVSALFGIYMVTSGCPVLGKLKPMVRTHLPFASLKETAYRMVSMYLLGQYFRARKKETPDWELKNIGALLQNIRKVNRSFCKRLHSVCEQDASLNAVVRLDCFADNSAFQVEKKGLDEIEATFDSFFHAD